MMPTDFITKTPDGVPSDIISDKNFIKLFNIFADNTKNGSDYLADKQKGDMAFL